MKNGTKLIAVLLCVLLLIPTMAFAETQSSLDAEIAQSAEGMSALGGKKGELLKDQEQFPQALPSATGLLWPWHCPARRKATPTICRR